MGPKFGPLGPKNWQGKALELLGSEGATTPGTGTVQSPIQQIVSALAASPFKTNTNYLKERKAMDKIGSVRATEGQLVADARRRVRAMPAYNNKEKKK